MGDHFGGDGVCARDGGTVRLQHHRYHRGRHDADGGGGDGRGFVNPFPYLFASAISHGIAVGQALARPHFQHASIWNDGGLPGSVCYTHWQSSMTPHSLHPGEVSIVSLGTLLVPWPAEPHCGCLFLV